MPERLLLLTAHAGIGPIIDFLNQRATPCQVAWVNGLDMLDAATAGDKGGTRLLSFCNEVIVPAALLRRLGQPAYNIHPGPPEFPGSNPECWGAYFGVARFGATLHFMTEKVDAGPIVDVFDFEVPPGTGVYALGKAASAAALKLLARWCLPLLTDDRPLPVGSYVWGARKWRRADQEAMSRIPDDIDAAEFERRVRAFAERPGGALTIVRHGREFIYAPPLPPDPAP